MSEYLGQCKFCDVLFSATKIDSDTYSIPVHGGSRIAGFHPEQRFKLKDVKMVFTDGLVIDHHCVEE